MTISYDLLGSDRAPVLRNHTVPMPGRPLFRRRARSIRLCPSALGAAKDRKPVYLPKDLLEKLHARFSLANPKGTRIVAGSQFEDYAPPGLTREDKDRLYE